MQNYFCVVLKSSLPKMRDYWSVDQGLGNTLIQKTMTRDRFLEILQNLHFVDNLQKLPPKESESFHCAWKFRSFFDHYWSIFKRLFYQNHISLSMNTCVNSSERDLCTSTWRISQLNGFQILVLVRFQVWVFVSIWYVFGKKVQNRAWSWSISCSLPLRQFKNSLLLCVLWQLFYKSKSHAKTIWGWNLGNWNRQIKP